VYHSVTLAQKVRWIEVDVADSVEVREIIGSDLNLKMAEIDSAPGRLRLHVIANFEVAEISAQTVTSVETLSTGAKSEACTCMIQLPKLFSENL
jgi:hypothetical protein